MSQLKPRPYRSAIAFPCFVILVVTFVLGGVIAQQQPPATKITPLMEASKTSNRTVGSRA
jgi:hypothetical protein